MHLTSLVLAALFAWTPSILAKKKDDAVLLSKVKSLTLRDGYETSHRRVEPLPQLNCIGGNAKGLYNVDVMRCTNSGSEYDSEDIQWTCKAELPPEFKLGSTDVICEGYDSADDPHILKGSCGVEYRLILTNLGEQKYHDHVSKGGWKSESSGKQKKEGSDRPAAILFWIIFALIVGVILYSIFWPSAGNRDGRGFNDGYRAGYGGGGGGGGGDDGYTDPPPPYTPRAPKSKTSSTRSSNARGSAGRQDQTFRPGFWTGAATGAAAGYAGGTWNANRQHRNAQQQDYAAPGRSSWFEATNPSPRAGPSNSSPPVPSSSRQESTGFGGTSRR